MNTEFFVVLFILNLFKDRLLNLKKRCGSIYNKIIYPKYRKTSTKTKAKELKPKNTNVENEDAVPNDPSDDETAELSYLLYFKTCLVDANYRNAREAVERKGH